jgi:hypothetical protein
MTSRRLMSEILPRISDCPSLCRLEQRYPYILVTDDPEMVCPPRSAIKGRPRTPTMPPES